MFFSLFCLQQKPRLFSQFLTANGEIKNIPKMDELLYAPNTTSDCTHLFNFEKNFDYKQTQIWMKGHFPYCFSYSTLYAILVFGGKHYMANRPKYDLKRMLALWSAGLALFSIMATYRIMPIVFHSLRQHGLYYNICIPLIYHL